MFTLDNIARFREEIKFYKLSAPVELLNLTDAELLAICNGWGPDSWPRQLRKALTKLAGAYAVLHVPHDVRYEFKLGGREVADREFYDNALRIWRVRWGWQRWIRPAAIAERAKLYLCYRALAAFSREAWEK